MTARSKRQNARARSETRYLVCKYHDMLTIRDACMSRDSRWERLSKEKSRTPDSCMLNKYIKTSSAAGNKYRRQKT